MVSRRLKSIAVILTAFASSAVAAPQAFGVRRVQVIASGEWSADPNGVQTKADCAKFRLTDTAALRWFQHSHEVAQPRWLEEGEWTQCSARGRLVTDGGRSYDWTLDQGGRAPIMVSADVAVYLLGPELPRSKR